MTPLNGLLRLVAALHALTALLAAGFAGLLVASLAGCSSCLSGCRPFWLIHRSLASLHLFSGCLADNPLVHCHTQQYTVIQNLTYAFSLLKPSLAKSRGEGLSVLTKVAST